MRVATLFMIIAEHGFASFVGSQQYEDQALQFNSEKSVHAEAVHEESVHAAEVYDTPNENCSTFGYSWQEGYPSMYTRKGQICPRKRNTLWQTGDQCQWAKAYPKGANIAFVHVGKASGSTLSMTLTRAIKYFGVNMNISELHTGSDRPGHGLEQDWDLLIVATRDPVTRTISALNYEMEASPESLKHKKLIGKLVECYPTAPGGANNFSRDLNENTLCGQVARRCMHEASTNYPRYDPYNAKVKRFNPKENWVQSYCGHVNMNHAHYLAKDRMGTPNLMTQIRLGDARAWIVRTETFDEDMDGLFKWLCIDKTTAAESMPPKVVPQVTKDKGTDRHEDTNVEPQNLDILRNHLHAEYQTLEALEQLADNGRINSEVEKIASLPLAPLQHTKKPGN